jgi:hypothetical protein
MPQPFVIIGNIVFAGNDLLEGRVEAYDRPFYLTCGMNPQRTHIRRAIAKVL